MPDPSAPYLLIVTDRYRPLIHCFGTWIEMLLILVISLKAYLKKKYNKEPLFMKRGVMGLWCYSYMFRPVMGLWCYSYFFFFRSVITAVAA